MLLRLALAAVPAVLAAPAGAQVSFFNDPVAFQTAAQSFGLVPQASEDFEEAARASPYSAALADPIDEYTSDASFSPGDIVPEIRVQTNILGQVATSESPRGANGIYLRDRTSFTPSVSLTHNYPSDSMDLVLRVPTAAVSFTFMSVLGDSPNGEVYVYDASGNQIGSVVSPARQDGTVFVGVLATGAASLDRINVWKGTGGSFVGYDDVAVWSASSLSGDVATLSLASGGSQVLVMNVGVTHALGTYQIVGGVSGTSPGFPFGGKVIPLNPDPYTVFTVLNPNTPPLLNSAGTLDINGRATAVFLLPPGTDPALAGVTLHHAGVVLTISGPTISVSEVTTPAPLQLVP